jgi:hypothetical protein
LCALGFGFLENQPDTFELLWLVEQESEDLGSGLSSAPAPSLSELQRTFNGIGFVFRGNLDHSQVGQIEPAPIKRYAVEWNRRNQAFAHTRQSRFRSQSDHRGERELKGLIVFLAHGVEASEEVA